MYTPYYIMEPKIIAHIDMDAFFAAIEERDRPWLRGFPIVVGADPKGGAGRGVVSTANYKAREYGIHSALPISKAWAFSQLAGKRGEPSVAFITPGFGRYSEASAKIFKTVKKIASVVQITSIDEAYIDLSHTGSFKKAKETCVILKRKIKSSTKLTCSIGLAPNKMVAKIASDFAKPDGLTVVEENEVFDFLAPLPIGKIPGVGPKAQSKLKKLGIETVEDSRKFSFEVFEKHFGKYGFDLYQKVNGVGSSNLEERSERKSIGHHETFSEDTNSMNYIFKVLERMAENIISQIKKSTYKGFRTTVFTIRFADFETKQRSNTSKELVTSEKVLVSKAIKLTLPFFEKKNNPAGKSIRMVGLRVEKLE